MSSALDGLPVGWTGSRVSSTGSTNADLLAAARAGAPPGTVLVADEQTAGRGRLGRTWVTPAGTALAVSVLLRPAVESAWWTWLPLLAGLSVLDAVAEVAPVLAVSLKWPNDVLVAGADGERKLAGVLVERDGPAVVIGIGVNVTVAAHDLPADAVATSLLAAGAPEGALDRQRVLGHLLGALAGRFDRWAAAATGVDHSGGLAGDYRARCSTLGRQVRVELGAGELLDGVALDVGPDGELLVRPAGAPPAAPPVAVRAGDVRHLRSGSARPGGPGGA